MWRVAVCCGGIVCRDNALCCGGIYIYCGGCIVVDILWWIHCCGYIAVDTLRWIHCGGNIYIVLRWYCDGNVVVMW